MRKLNRFRILSENLDFVVAIANPKNKNNKYKYCV